MEELFEKAYKEALIKHNEMVNSLKVGDKVKVCADTSPAGGNMHVGTIKSIYDNDIRLNEGEPYFGYTLFSKDMIVCSLTKG